MTLCKRLRNNILIYLLNLLELTMANYSIIKTCQYCGKEFTAKRKEAKFCSASCRTKAYRKRHGIPFPDFSTLVQTNIPSEKENKLLILNNELQNLIEKENELQKDYQNLNKKYLNALEIYKNNQNNWSRENTNRRKKELSEINAILLDISLKKKKIVNNIQNLQKGIDREYLENRQLIMSADELKKMKFDILKFSGIWEELLGQPPSNFFMIIYGQAKSGKTTFSLKFANYLKNFGSVVYIAVYERISFTLQRKLIDYDISGIDISRAKNKGEISFVVNKGKYDFVIIDSAIQASLNIGDIEEMKVQNPNTSFITVFQVSEADNIKLSEIYKQRCDILVNINKGVATSTGMNIPKKKFQIFEENSK